MGTTTLEALSVFYFTTQQLYFCNKIALGFECSFGVPGYYEDPRDCTKFYQCDDQGMEFHLDCPGNLHFNVETSQCMSPEEAGCEVIGSLF